MPLANMSVQAAVVGSAEMMEPMWRTFRLAPLMMHGERADEAEGCCQKISNGRVARHPELSVLRGLEMMTRLGTPASLC